MKISVCSVLYLFLAVCTSMSAPMAEGAQGSIYDRARVTELWEPVPPSVIPGRGRDAPSDAVVLFDGSHLDQWETIGGGAAGWEIEDGFVTVVPGAGDIRTKESFSDVQLHIEWRAPREIQGESQGRGNSGVFLMDRYEIQILDSHENPTYANGQAGSVYKQHIPLVNASMGPGEWQSYDVIFTAPRFSETGTVIAPARVTVLHNGVLVQHNVSIQGPTAYVGASVYKAHRAAPVRLQDHANPVSFRNIWIRRL